MIEPCTCDPIPARDLVREARKGAALVDVTDEHGRWHAVQVGEEVYRLVLVEPSAEELARAEAHREAMLPEEEARERERHLDAAAGPRGRLLAALVLRASSGWSSLPAAARQRVQAVIDNAADRVRDLLT